MVVNTIYSRYGQERIVKTIGESQYTIEGEARYCRGGMNEANTEVAYLDPEGGPFICVGDNFHFDPQKDNLMIESIRSEPTDTPNWVKIVISVREVQSEENYDDDQHQYDADGKEVSLWNKWFRRTGGRG
jgi:hypothetical protein